MRMKRLFDKARETVDRRGGVGSLKEDAAELRDIAKGESSVTEKAKQAGKAIKEPGASGVRDGGSAGATAEGEPSGDGTSGTEEAPGAGTERRTGSGS